MLQSRRRFPVPGRERRGRWLAARDLGSRGVCWGDRWVERELLYRFEPSQKCFGQRSVPRISILHPGGRKRKHEVMTLCRAGRSLLSLLLFSPTAGFCFCASASASMVLSSAICFLLRCFPLWQTAKTIQALAVLR
jgi:hypothetical protein